MQAKTPSDELLRQLSTAVAPVEDAALVAARRERVIAHLADRIPTLSARREQRRRLAWVLSFSSAAAIAAAIGFVATRGRTAFPEARPESIGALFALEGSVQVIHRADEVVAPPFASMAVGSADEVVTGQGGRARASLASGAEVDIGPDSKVRLRGDQERPAGAAPSARSTSSGAREAVVLGAGRVTVRVPKLGPARSFAVETPEATVVVHGTAFSVERSAASGSEPRTSVDVTEGSVAVRHHGVEVLLRAGDHWSSAARGAEHEDVEMAGPRTAPIEAAPVKPKAAGSNGRAGSSVKGSSDAASSEKSSSLAAENRLLQAAMAARQKGDARRAADLAADLVARYPASPLIEEARVERMRALLGAGVPAAAEAEARAYLVDYPRGFARSEAGRIVAGAPR